MRVTRRGRNPHADVHTSSDFNTTAGLQLLGSAATSNCKVESTLFKYQGSDSQVTDYPRSDNPVEQPPGRGINPTTGEIDLNIPTFHGAADVNGKTPKQLGRETTNQIIEDYYATDREESKVLQVRAAVFFPMRTTCPG